MPQTEARRKRKLAQLAESSGPPTNEPSNEANDEAVEPTKKPKHKKNRKQSAAEPQQLADGSSLCIEGDTATPEQLMLRIRHLLKTLKPPVHIAALSMAFAKHVGGSIKKYHKRGGMLNFVNTHMSDELLVIGKGNDSFLQNNSERNQTLHWLRCTIHEHGPILVSMLGRMYHEQHDVHFADVYPDGVHKFISRNLPEQVTLTASKGQELVAELTDKQDSRFFVGKKKRRKVDGDDAAEAPEEAQSTLRERSADGAMPYRNTDRILVVGDADLSWSRSLVHSWGGEGANLVATTYESKDELISKYGKACVKENRRILRAAGAKVIHGVDATTLSVDSLKEAAGGTSYDFIVFNFPHTGTDEGLAKSIDQNRELLRRFLGSCPPVLQDQGTSEVHVALVHRYPYSAWKICELAPDELRHIEMLPFNAQLYPQYNHRKTSLADVQTSVGLDGEPCVVHVFGLKAKQ